MQGRGETREALQKAFRDDLVEPLARAQQIKEADLVIGIPFYNEIDTVTQVINTVEEGVRKYYPHRKVVVVLAGAPQGAAVLRAISDLPLVDPPLFRLAFIFQHQEISGKGWSIRAIMEIAGELGADLVILEADLVTRVQQGETVGLVPEWVQNLWEPVRSRQVDLLLPRFTRYYMDDAIGDNLVYPVVTALYNIRIRQPLTGEMGISRRLLTHYQEQVETWGGDVGSYGIDVWMLTEAIVWGANIGETYLGIKLHRPSAGKQELVVRQVAKTLFEQVEAHREWWEKRNGITQLSIYGSRLEQLPPHWSKFNYPALIQRYRHGYHRFHDVLLKHVLPEEVYSRLTSLASMQEAEFNFPSRLWAQVVYALLLAFSFSQELAKGDILNALVMLFQGRVGSMARELEGLRSYLERLAPDRVDKLLALEAERLVAEQVEEFVRERPTFLTNWEKESRAQAPFIPKIARWEFIPGVPLVLPQEIPRVDGSGVVNIATIYEELLREYREGFYAFVHGQLGVPAGADSREISQAVRHFLEEVEETLHKFLLPGDIATVEGTREVVETIKGIFSREPLFALKPEVATWLVRRYPPVNLMTRWGCADAAELLEGRDPVDILALASWAEDWEFGERINEWLADYARPEHFADTSVKILVVAHEDFPALVEMKEASALSRLTGRVVVANLRKNTGGDFPRLRYLTLVGKNIVEAERFSQVWREFAQTKTQFGEKVLKSMEGHWGSTPLSAHNILENGHQRVLVERLKEAAVAWRNKNRELAEKLALVASSYHLALTLPDGKFVPCSAWTWASYSFKGGKGVPTPLSLHVERDWFSRELIFRYAAAAGIPAASIERQLVELVGWGREAEDLAELLFGEGEMEEVVLEQQPVAGYQAGELHRYAGNPILEPIPQHAWEARYVLNCAAIRLRGRIYLVYRAFGHDGVSRLGLAVSSDGYHVDERLPEPIFVPQGSSEQKGCEDPRIVLLDGWIYMLYTAYDGILPQVAMARIGVDDFVNYRWAAWERCGLVFPGVANKDALLFPDKFDGWYAMYHRVAPSLWISYSDCLSCPWPREGHKIVIGPRSGLMWDAMKIGAGAPPLKTKYGWLLIYHGVDHALVYRLGVLLVDLQDPAKVLYRSPNAILEPGTVHEIGDKDKSWVPNVVFTCGALPKEDKEILDDDDGVLVYYGAADTVISVAEARVSELLPLEVRQMVGAKVAW